MSWAQANRRKTAWEWDAILLSDECYIHLNGTAGHVWVTRTVNEVYNEACLVPAFKQLPVRVMVWSCIAHDWKGPLVILNYPGGKGGGMSAERYQKQVLRTHVVKAMKDLCHHCARKIKIQYQQDSAFCHTAESTIKWLENYKIPLVPHRACSPNVSPIEPVWHELKKHICA
ncbi:unnamed protein product [Mycena citricolor]|uniref:Tc1-like transposase DDE domain-containing protein n=1 Tax=Mycena citricolor TaxID=2018698 RepID=A0AAD2H5J3_9AGAR|nr:unnamed protein product [Mycena citricolor]